MPLPLYSPCMNLNGIPGDDQLELIASYFEQGYTNLEIVEFLKLHGIEISLSTVKRRLQTLGLSRKPDNIPNDELKQVIEREIGGSGCFVGYRRLWARLRRKGYFVKRSRIMTMLREIDPEGVESRKRKRLRRRTYQAKGPNYVWHIDGYDKLKPYGFCVHGGIDGFSRRLIWLEVGTTNNNPEVITKFYLDALKQVGGLPRKVRSDDGTENSMVEAVHTFLRSSHSDEDAGLGCFLTGRSTANQRIEAYWSHLVKDGPGWKELYQVAELWNQHIISSSKFGNSSGPRGRPDCMFFLPHLYGTDDFKVTFDEDEVEEFIDHSTMSPPDYSEDFKEFAQTIMNELNLQEPHDVNTALELYIKLLKEVEKLT
ncbi:hypothetical protein ACROYT_G032997 [Oculina patagonica]